MLIALDAGHMHGIDSGAQGCGYNEETLTLQMSQKVGAILKSKGYNVIYVRPSSATSVPDSLVKRVQAANNAKANYFVSFHLNASNGQGHGAEVWTNTANVNGKKLATNVLNAICKGFKFTNRGIKDGCTEEHLYVIRNTNMSAILIETCFIDNVSDMKIYTANIDKIANTIAMAIINSVK